LLRPGVEAHGLLPGLVLLALHRGKRPLAAAFARKRLVQGQLAGAAVVAALGLATAVAVARAAVVTVAVGLARAGRGAGGAALCRRFLGRLGRGRGRSGGGRGGGLARLPFLFAAGL